MEVRQGPLLQPTPVSAAPPTKLAPVPPSLPPHLKRPRRRRRAISKKTLAIGLVAGAVALSGYVSIDSWLTNRQVKAEHTQQSANNGGVSTPAGDDTPVPPSVVDSYKVGPTLPRVIRIESIELAARILRVGVTPTDALDTPKNSNDTGWYEGSAKPGESGPMVIDGHYSGPTQAGVFHGIEKLKPGARITVERGDGKVFTYAVKTVERMPADKVPMDQLLSPSSPKGQDLNLITCTGTYNAKTETYDKRVVVRATAL
jgi:sortase (surface protein transpeptidase)